MSIVPGQWKYYITEHISFQLHIQRCYIAILKSAVVGVFVPWTLGNATNQEFPPSAQLVKHLSVTQQSYETGTFSFYR